MTEVKSSAPISILPEKPFLKVGRYEVRSVSPNRPFFSYNRRFKQNLNVIMKVETFADHSDASEVVFPDEADWQVMSDRFWSLLAVKQAADESYWFDYALNDVESITAESGLTFEEMPCLIREASKAGLLSPDKKPISFDGVTTWLSYRGTRGSAFPLHREDMNLWSINYLAAGSPKVWYVVPPGHYDRAIVQLQAALIANGVEGASCPAFEMHNSCLVDPEWFDRKKIPLNVVVQMPGQAVVIHPLALHQGFNVGRNLAFATNFGTADWLQYGIDCPVVRSPLCLVKISILRPRLSFIQPVCL